MGSCTGRAALRSVADHQSAMGQQLEEGRDSLLPSGKKMTGNSDRQSPYCTLSSSRDRTPALLLLSSREPRGPTDSTALLDIPGIGRERSQRLLPSVWDRGQSEEGSADELANGCRGNGGKESCNICRCTDTEKTLPVVGHEITVCLYCDVHLPCYVHAWRLLWLNNVGSKVSYFPGWL